mmetsp:Transcript_6961/g.20111  ORF Transcript_6961/g.20111 Transcript_6961/m.20111 type:complete len:268 (+) Transcript_6961:275-1078(+)
MSLKRWVKLVAFRGSLERPQVNRRKAARSSWENSRRTRQNALTWVSDAEQDEYSVTDMRRSMLISGWPQTMVSSSWPLKRDRRERGTMVPRPRRTLSTWASNSCMRNCSTQSAYSRRLAKVTVRSRPPGATSTFRLSVDRVVKDSRPTSPKNSSVIPKSSIFRILSRLCIIISSTPTSMSRVGAVPTSRSQIIGAMFRAMYWRVRIAIPMSLPRKQNISWWVRVVAPGFSSHRSRFCPEAWVPLGVRMRRGRAADSSSWAYWDHVSR